MNLRNGDVKIIKTAWCGRVAPLRQHHAKHSRRGVRAGRAEQILIIGHHDCGMSGFVASLRIIEKARARGISDDIFHTLQNSAIELNRWLVGFDKVEDGVTQSVKLVRNHPLLPKDVPVHGLLIHPVTGKLQWLVDGYAAIQAVNPEQI